MSDLLKYTSGNYFCSSQVRPSCLKTNTNQCCLYCNMIEKCQEQNKSKTKPCTADIVSLDEYCPYSV